MAVDSNLEREYKFDVDPGFEPPDLRPLVGRTERLPEQNLVSTYFDTPDRRLWAAGITLRHRRDSDGDGQALGKWTLKLPEPGDLGQRGSGQEASVRTELNWKGALAQVPSEVGVLVAGIARRQPLTTLAVLSSVRRRLLLHAPDDGDRAWAEIDDDTVTVTSGGREGLRFRQLEVELIGPPPPEGAVEAVLAELGKAGAGPGGGSKIGLAAGLEPPTTAVGGPELASWIGAVMSTGLGRLLGADLRLRIPAVAGDRDSVDVKAVHDARTAARRLRSDIQTFSSVLDPVWAGHVKTQLKLLGQLLGRLRDEDVLVERVRREAGDPEAAEELVGLLRADRHLAAGVLVEHLSSDAYFDLLDKIHAAAQRPAVVAGGDKPQPAGDAPSTVETLLVERWQKVESRIRGLDSDPAPEALHRVRIQAKRLRYAAEAAEPVTGRPAHRMAKAAHRLQTVLGDLNDAVNASRELSRFAAHPSVPSSVAFEAGRIAGRAEAEAEILNRRWKGPAKRLRQRARKGWS